MSSNSTLLFEVLETTDYIFIHKHNTTGCKFRVVQIAHISEGSILH